MNPLKSPLLYAWSTYSQYLLVIGAILLSLRSLRSPR